MRLRVEDVFVIRGRGVVISGRVHTGAIRTGDRLWLLGGDEPVGVTVRGMERLCMRGGDRDLAEEGTTIGLLVGGVEAADVRRDMWLADTPAG